jgi:RNA methyltransferase, TrmH family
MNFADLKKLHQRKFRDDAGWFLIEGEHLVLELQKALARDERLQTSEIYVTPEYSHWKSPLPVHMLNARQMAQLTETRSPQGIVAVVPLVSGPSNLSGTRAVYLYEIQDPGNLGTILRTLAWFGGFRCLLSPNSVDVHNGKAVRASMGALFHVPIEIDVPLETLPLRFSRIARLDLHGQPIATPEFRDFDCYIYGNEARGLPNAALSTMHTTVFTISGSGAIESLNVAASVNICQYELARNGSSASLANRTLQK